MRRTSEEIERSMSGFEAEGGFPLARFRFDESFIGFDGHFPSGKVLPGVCQIQCVKAVLKRWKGVGPRILEVVSAKYLAPVSPGEEIVVRIRDAKNVSSGEVVLKATLSRGDQKIADFSLRVSFGGTVSSGA